MKSEQQPHLSSQRTSKAILLVVILVTLAVWQTQLFAQQKTQDLMNMSVDDLMKIQVAVSSTKPTTLLNTPSSVTVIDQSMIKAYNVLSVSDALALVPGFSNWRTYMKRDLPTARGILQDMYANKVLVMINNVPSWNAVTGEPTLNRVDINDVERIEVLKGPASVLYGTNAYAGAINIVLKNRSSRPEGSAYARIGDRREFSAGGNYIFKRGDFTLFAAGSGSSVKGYNQVFKDESGTSGHLNEYTYGSNLTVAAQTKHHSILFNTFNFHESFLGNTLTFASGAGRDEVTDGSLFNYTLSVPLAQRVHLTYGLVHDWNQRNFSRSADDRTRSNIDGYNLTNYLKSEWLLTDKLTASVGFDYNYRKDIEYKNYNTLTEATLEENNLKDRSQNESSVYGDLGLRVSHLNLLAGTRYTHNSVFGGNVSSRGTAVWEVNETNSFKAIVGQSFRSPSFFEQYFQTSAKTVFGNPNLQPEKSTSYEFAYLTSFRKLFVQALGYHAIYDNKITRVQKDKVLVYSNSSEFSANGLELEMKYNKPEFVNTFLNYSFISGDKGDQLNNDGNYNFKYIPRHTISAGMAKSIKNLSLSGMVSLMSSMHGPKLEIPKQATADVSVGYTHQAQGHTVYHSLSVRNLFDKDVVLPEYVRRNVLNEVTAGLGRAVVYTLRVGI